MDDKMKIFTEDWRSVMNQNQFWVSADGTCSHLNDLEPMHCARIVGYIIRTLGAVALRDFTSMASGPQPGGDAACDAFDSEMGFLENVIDAPMTWANTTPLIKALNRRIDNLYVEDDATEADKEMVWMRKPYPVRAEQYDGANGDLVAALSPFSRFTEGVIRRAEGTTRGLTIWGEDQVTVCVGEWMVLDDGQLKVFSDTSFREDYGNEEDEK